MSVFIMFMNSFFLMHCMNGEYRPTLYFAFVLNISTHLVCVVFFAVIIICA